MIVLLRIVFAAGMLVAVGYAIAFLRTRRRVNLRRSLLALVITLGLALLFFAGMVVERLIST